MRICSIISHTAIGCGGLIGGWLVAVGQLGVVPFICPSSGGIIWPAKH